MDTTVLTWMLAGVSTVVGSLSLVVVTLWRITEKNNRERIDVLETELVESRKRHDDCEKDRLDIHKQLSGLMAVVEGRGHGKPH